MPEQEKKQGRMKYCLAEAMKRCMKKSPVEKITVKEIAEECGTTRQTFYRNFQDKYDLINKFHYIEEEKLFFRAAFKTDDQNSLREHDFRLILQFYTERIEEKTGRKLSEQMKFLLEMYCQGSIYMTVQWVLGQIKGTPEQIARSLVDAMPSQLEQIPLFVTFYLPSGLLKYKQNIPGHAG